MKSTRVKNKDGSETQTNWVLDEVIEACEGYNIPDDLIKKLAVQKFEYGRTCSAELFSQGRSYYPQFDNVLKHNIVSLGGKPKGISVELSE